MSVWLRRVSSASAPAARYPFLYIACVLSLFSAAVLTPASAEAAEVVLKWNNPSKTAGGKRLSALAGFRVYFGTKQRRYSEMVDVGSANSYAIVGLRNKQTYHFAVTAYDAYGNESTYSKEVIRTIGGQPGSDPNDWDGDGIPNNKDSDADGDGLSNEDEKRIGTDWLNSDTDGDGVDDGTELKQGSNPLDGGHALPSVGKTICAAWNGYLGGMWNVYEHVNRTDSPIYVQTTLFDSRGSLSSTTDFILGAFGQNDALVHDLEGHDENTYGKVCSRHYGPEGGIDGRMVYYKPNNSPETQSGDFQFAFAMPMSNGKKGRQYVPLNNNHGSLSGWDVGDGVANWIQVTNLSGANETGELRFYDPQGTVIGRQALSFKAGGRADFGAHMLGAGAVGLVEWRPTNPNAEFLVWNGRYYYDNPHGIESFDSAVQIEGLLGSGEDQYVPVDTINRTAVVEISNTSKAATTVDVEVHGGPPGISVYRLELPAHGSYHFILDPILGPNQVGFVKIKGYRPNSIIAVAMEYGHRSEGSLTYAYALPAKGALGADLRGSYNTYLGQNSWLVTVTTEPQLMQMRMLRPNGKRIAAHDFYSENVSVTNLNSFEQADQYGTVSVVPAKRNTVVSWVLRAKGDEYVMPTPMR